MEQNSSTENLSRLNAEKIVVGANTLAHFNVRCPACHKLFRVDSREIKSSSPHFDCSSCRTRFTFDFPPLSPNKVETRAVPVLSPADPRALADLRNCWKCAAPNPKISKECLKCGVLFGPGDDFAEDASLGAIPSLVKAWQDLMSDYSNATKHLAFVDRCEDLQALPYALKKYQTLKEAQPMDSVAQKMFHQVLLRNFQRGVQKISWLRKSQQILLTAYGRVNWLRVRKLSPFALSFGLILLGLSSHAARNMVGVGAAILFLTVGLTLFIKGRISAEDFW